MRVSKYFKLGRTQPTLSFVDVDIEADVRLFVSPRAIRLLTTEWGDECVSLVQSFFSKVLSLIRAGQHVEAVSLLEMLREPNETHLGLSKGPSRGRVLGSGSAENVWDALSKSKAARSGLLTDLEDTVLMIEGISVDIVSDVVTNIIRGPLIAYTQEACKQYGIPLTPNVVSGPLWNPITGKWASDFVELPMAKGDKLLLVPKIIVRQDMDYDVDKYYRHYILEHLRQVELKANSNLVYVLKSKKNKGKRKVYQKDLKKKYGVGKPTVIEQTLENPHLLQDYKNDNLFPSNPLTHRQISEAEESPLPNWSLLLRDVTSVLPGKEGAYKYESAVEALLSAMMYPVLAHPRVQTELHDGRKRIDITYTNMASQGFFKWLSAHYPAAHVFFECKNYGKDLANPELDQIAGRFSPSRGQFGIIVCREFHDKAKFSQRCKDTAQDGRGYILALDDADLAELVADIQGNLDFFELTMLKDRFDELIM